MDRAVQCDTPIRQLGEQMIGQFQIGADHGRVERVVTPDAAGPLPGRLERFQPMLRLPPSRDTQERADADLLLDRRPDRIPQQTQVRRIFDIRLDHEAVAPRLQPRIHRMTHGPVTQPDDRAVDLRQDIVCQKRNGVRQCRRRHGG